LFDISTIYTLEAAIDSIAPGKVRTLASHLALAYAEIHEGLLPTKALVSSAVPLESQWA
jgi:hypothetical protein